MNRPVIALSISFPQAIETVQGEGVRPGGETQAAGGAEEDSAGIQRGSQSLLVREYSSSFPFIINEFQLNFCHCILIKK